ncbi:MAG: helix-turn-helix transcriptional regulator [Clostridia bacterium]|nr:helix-turn-helix transcriptional regulator [Clostridia bacterium]
MAELRQDDEMLYDLADLFRMFADSTRVRILNELMRKDVGVTELANELQMTTSAISHQLRILKDSRLIRSRRDGKGIMYSLADDHVRTILDMGIEHLIEGARQD